MIICTYDIVDLIMVIIFWVGVGICQMGHVLFSPICLCITASRSPVCWIGCLGYPGKIGLCVPQRLEPGKRCEFAIVINGL